MPSSLRSRLWLSYVVLALAALTVVAAGLVIALQRNPLLYRQTVYRLRLAEGVITQRIEDMNLPRGILTGDRVEKLIQREAEARQLRIAILNSDGTPLLDAGVGITTPLPTFSAPLKTTEDDPNQVQVFRDSTKTDWFYTLKSLDGSRYLLVATPIPALPLRQIFRDEILGPFLQAALVALLLAIVLSLFLGSWILKPLRKISQAAIEMADGNYRSIPPEGPLEVHQLAESFNEMAHRVQVSQNSQREFIANVSHELKTPLTSIQGFAQAILDGTAQSPEMLKQSAAVIYNETGRMHRLVLDLLVLARLDAGTADLQQAPVDLTTLLKNVTDKFALQARQGEINLSCEAGTLPPVLGDGDRLAQVFTNLVDNALKFTPPGGQIQLSTMSVDGMALVTVRDSGVGIAPEDQVRIFERFYQVDKSRRGGGGRGVGLGLAIAAQIVKAHGGQIWVESRQGTGSTFYVRLPVLGHPEQPPSARKAQP